MIIHYCVANVSTRNLIIYSLEVFETEFLLYSIGVFLFSMIYLILNKLVELKYFSFNTNSIYWYIIWGIILFLIPMLISILLVRYFMLTLDKLKALFTVLLKALGPLLFALAMLALLSLLGLGMILGLLWDLLKGFLLGLFGALALTILFALLMALFGLLMSLLLGALLAWMKISVMGGFMKVHSSAMLEKRKEIYKKQKAAEAAKDHHVEEDDKEDDANGL